MNYSKAIKAKNVKIQMHSPRMTGETSARSEYQEIAKLPFSFAERVEMIEKLAQENEEVIIKTATRGGRARIFVKPFKGLHKVTVSPNDNKVEIEGIRFQFDFAETLGDSSVTLRTDGTDDIEMPQFEKIRVVADELEWNTYNDEFEFIITADDIKEAREMAEAYESAINELDDLYEF